MCCTKALPPGSSPNWDGAEQNVPQVMYQPAYIKTKQNKQTLIIPLSTVKDGGGGSEAEEWSKINVIFYSMCVYVCPNNPDKTMVD